MMIAYNDTWLKNLQVCREAQRAYTRDYISKTELENIRALFPTGFYSPNIFIRIGLFLLSFIIVLFSFGLIALFIMDAIEKIWAVVALIVGFIVYGVLEMMVQQKNHYRSGVDDALMWSAAGFIFAGISNITHAGLVGNCLLAFLVSIYSVTRFADRSMAAAAFISVYGFFFFLFSTNITLTLILPFVLMSVSAIIYFILLKLKQYPTMALYKDGVEMVTSLAVLSFYISGNYYVVRELGNELLNTPTAANEGIPFGWVFWIFTVAVPLIYLFRGIQIKDTLLIRSGLLLIAATVITIYFYFPLLPVEFLMAILGSILLGLAYLLTRYLSTPKYGFIYTEVAVTSMSEKPQIESLIIAETFSNGQIPGDATKFGGGSFGGGGSTSDF